MAKTFELMEEHTPAPSGNKPRRKDLIVQKRKLGKEHRQTSSGIHIENRLSSRITRLGIVLPAPPTPLGMYVESSDAGNLFFLQPGIENRQTKETWARRSRQNDQGATCCRRADVIHGDPCAIFHSTPLSFYHERLSFNGSRQFVES